MCLLSAYKVKYPISFFLLRGANESAAVTRVSPFYDECKRCYNVSIWKAFNNMFNCLPVAAIVGKKIFAVHGGLSPDLESMESIRKIERPIDVSVVPIAVLMWHVAR